MRAVLYAVHTSHPSHAARLMLEFKGIEHRVVQLVPGTHAAVVRLLGFPAGTVPAMKLDGRRVQGTRAIARALDSAQPQPPLFPAGAAERARVAEVERWADEELQQVPRRIANWVFLNRPAMRSRLARESGLPLARLAGPLTAPVTWWFARKHDARDPARVREAIASIPAALDRIDELIAQGMIGGEQRNAADFQIATSIRLLTTIEDLAPALADRPVTRLARAVIPDYPTGIPAGFVPREWFAGL